MVAELVRTAYRVSFADNLAYQVEFASSDADAWPVVTALIYRVQQNRRENDPMRRPDGTPMQFQAATEQGALGVACEVLQVINGTRPRSIILCDPD